MAEERLGGEAEDPLAAERARLREAARLLEAERERLRAEAGSSRAAGGESARRERDEGGWGQRGRGEEDEPGRRGRERYRRGGLLAALLGIDPELCEWWDANRPSRLLRDFLRDVPDDCLDHLWAGRREYLLAARSFIDYALEYSERRPARAPRRGAVPIEDA